MAPFDLKLYFVGTNGKKYPLDNIYSRFQMNSEISQKTMTQNTNLDKSVQPTV